MGVKVICLLLFAGQIILNQSVIVQVEDSMVSADNSTGSQVQSPNLPQGYRAFPDVNSAFKIHEVEATWFEARDRCLAEGARLAITDSREKIEHINSMKTQNDKWIHVGIHKVDDRWVRIDNDVPVSSVPWADDNPDGTGNCTGISITWQNGLVDYACEWGGEYFVCEIPH